MTHYLLPILFVFALSLPAMLYAAQSAPPLMLAKVAEQNLVYSDYLISEKFDGVRAFWNGSAFMTRSGRKITAPEWFTEKLPEQAFEGELWLGYGRFDEVSALVRRQEPTDELWQDVQLMVFDLPGHVSAFIQRVADIEKLVASIDQPWVKAVKRVELENAAMGQSFLAEVVAQGGEGLMLNEKSAYYVGKRTDSIVKMKPRYDDEAIVIGYTNGKGKYEGQVGALVVEWKNDRHFKIGSGLSDYERKNPPEIGSTVTFEYSGYTSTGLPRFARFIREYHAL